MSLKQERFNPRVDLNATLGVIFAGFGTVLFVYSLTLGQLIRYFRTNRQHSAIFTTLIIVLWILDSIHVALIASGLWSYVVVKRGDLQCLLRPTW